MSQQQPQMSHFDAAKSILEALKGLDKQSQTLAMRFASETLNLPPTVIAQTPVTPVSAALQPASQHDKHAATHSTDIKQFTDEKAPKSDQQFAAVVAYFYRFKAPKADQQDTIGVKTLKEASRLAGRNQPQRLGGPISRAGRGRLSGRRTVHRQQDN